MQLGVVLGVFALIFVAELPDKTMIATLIMGSRNRPVLVWIGATAAFGLHAALAVLAGRLLALLPHAWVEGVTAAAVRRGRRLPAARVRGGGGGGGRPRRWHGRRAGSARSATAFVVILVGEFGDLTQILTANLAARYHDPLSVFVGAFAALATVGALGAFSGRALLRVLPLHGDPQGGRRGAGRARRVLARHAAHRVGRPHRGSAR